MKKQKQKIFNVKMNLKKKQNIQMEWFSKIEPVNNTYASTIYSDCVCM